MLQYIIPITLLAIGVILTQIELKIEKDKVWTLFNRIAFVYFEAHSLWMIKRFKLKDSKFWVISVGTILICTNVDILIDILDREIKKKEVEKELDNHINNGLPVK